VTNPNAGVQIRRPRAGAGRAAHLMLAACLLCCPWSPAIAFAEREAAFPCADGDKECALKAAKGHAVTTLQFWQDAFAKPVEERIGPAPPELVELLNLENIKDGFPERPRATAIAPDFLRDLRAALAELPEAVKRRLSSRLAGIHLVDDLGGTGFTDQIVDERSNAVGGFVVLDAAVLGRHTANSWAGWKENTPFGAQPGFRLEAVIEKKPGDNRKNAIQYILLHELGHVLAITANVHPRWSTEPEDVQSMGDYPFARLSWAIDGNRYVTKFDASFPQRKDIVYYLTPKLAAGQMADTYAGLERTNFPTLYAATSPGDDFAEAFANYVHVVLMKKPFEIRITRDGRTAKRYGSCWKQARCAEKRKVLERILAAP
jgi:hypothetical protein